MWVEGWYHDDFVWKCSVLSGSAAIYNHHTVFRRIHEQNSSINIERTRDGRIKLIDEEKKYINIAQNTIGNQCLDKEIKRFIDFQNRRKQIIKDRKFLLLIYNIIFCGGLYRTKGQLLMDIFCYVLKH